MSKMKNMLIMATMALAASSYSYDSRSAYQKTPPEPKNPNRKPESKKRKKPEEVLFEIPKGHKLFEAVIGVRKILGKEEWIVKIKIQVSGGTEKSAYKNLIKRYNDFQEWCNDLSVEEFNLLNPEKTNVEEVGLVEETKVDSPALEKGDLNGECNRTACNNKNANYYNHSTQKYYCVGCARLINDENRSEALRLYGHDLCTPTKD